MNTPDTWSVSPACAWVELPDDDAAVMPFATDQPMTLSPAGALVWAVLVGDRSSDESMLEPPLDRLTTEQIVGEVAARVGEAPETVAPGVTGFLAQLESVGILSRSAPE